MKNYEAKWEYLTNKHSYRCPIQKEKQGKDLFIEMFVQDLHHLCHNTKWRREKYPLFLDSILNLRPVSHNYHLRFGSWGKITDYQAEKYEKFLERHPKIAEWVNNPVGELWN